jgi:hypothetical protein
MGYRGANASGMTVSMARRTARFDNIDKGLD